MMERNHSSHPEEDIKSVSKNILELLNKRTSSVKNIFGSDDEDDEELDAKFLEQETKEAERPARHHSTSLRNIPKGRKLPNDDNDDDIYIDNISVLRKHKSSNDSDEESEELRFSDGLEDDLMGDNEDRARLLAMTEVERENVLFERDLARQRKRERWELHQKLQREKKTTKRQSIPTNQRAWSQDIKMVDFDSEESDTYLPTTSKPIEKKDFSKQGAIVEETVELENVLPIVLSRSQIEQWLYRSFFQTDLVGFFVRLSLGISPSNGEQVYRLCQIDSVAEYYRTYTVNNSITKNAFNLRIGKAVKKFTIDSISNSPPTQKEFSRWLMELRHANCYIMRRRESNILVERIKYLQESPMTEKEIDHIVKEKRKLNILKRNPAAEKAYLIKEREIALQAGRDDEIERIDASLIIVNRKLSEAEAVRNSRSESMTSIFERNRRINRESAEAELERKKSNSNNLLDDSLNPFARKKTVSMFSSIVSSTTYKEDEHNLLPKYNLPITTLDTLAIPLTSGNSHVSTMGPSVPATCKESVTLDDLEIEIPGFYIFLIVDFIKSKAKCSTDVHCSASIQPPNPSSGRNPLAFLDQLEKSKSLI